MEYFLIMFFIQMGYSRFLPRLKISSMLLLVPWEFFPLQTPEKKWAGVQKLMRAAPGSNHSSLKLSPHAQAINHPELCLQVLNEIMITDSFIGLLWVSNEVGVEKPELISNFYGLKAILLLITVSMLFPCFIIMLTFILQNLVVQI